MRKLVVVADDFGLCQSVNDGIVEAYQSGIVTEISLMLGSPGTAHALELVKKHNIKHVGIHLLLRHWREHGDIVRRADYAKLFESLGTGNITQLFGKELAEFEEVLGRKPTHITSQFGIIVNKNVLEAAVAYAARYDIPMRLPVQSLYQDEPVMDDLARHYMEEHGVRTTDCFFGHIIGGYQTVRDCFIEDLESLACNTAEFMLHPGKASKELTLLSSLDQERQRDLKLALDADFKAEIARNGFTLSSYADAV